MQNLTDLELLQIEIKTIWQPTGRPARIQGPELVIGSTTAGLTAAVGAVPDDVADVLLQIVASAEPPETLDAPPVLLERCRQVLSAALGPVEQAPGSGPSYLVHDTVAFAPTGPLVRSNDSGTARLRTANPGNWPDDEWHQLIQGQLGPWVMAMHDDEVVSICHTARDSDLAVEAGTWTRPDARGRGYAASATAAWAALVRPTGKYIFYSTSGANISSQRVAARLQLRPIGWLWQLISSHAV